MNISITSNFPDLKLRLLNLQRDVADKAARSAVNATLAIAKTEMARSINREFNLTQAQIKPRLKIVPATLFRREKGIAGLLMATGKKPGQRSTNIIAFVEKKVTLAEGRRRKKAGTETELFVKIKRTGPKISLGKKAFIGNKGRTVFVRQGKGRLPIEALTTIDIPSMFNTKRINQIVVKLMQDRFPGILEKEAAFYTARFNKG